MSLQEHSQKTHAGEEDGLFDPTALKNKGKLLNFGQMEEEQGEGSAIESIDHPRQASEQGELCATKRIPEGNVSEPPEAVESPQGPWKQQENCLEKSRGKSWQSEIGDRKGSREGQGQETLTELGNSSGRTQEEKIYQCLYCGKSFNAHFKLVRHHRIHTGEKPYKCLDCGKSFDQKGNLIAHVRIHTGEKPYVCSDCGKSFSHKGSLVLHVRIHTGEKPYKCPDCGKCFSRLGSLKEHEKTHTGERPYACLDCGRGFRKISELRGFRLTTPSCSDGGPLSGADLGASEVEGIVPAKRNLLKSPKSSFLGTDFAWRRQKRALSSPDRLCLSPRERGGEPRRTG